MADILRDAAIQPSEVTKALEELRTRVERGEISCIALRVYRADGSWEDVVIGGTEQEQGEALASLRRGFEQAH